MSTRHCRYAYLTAHNPTQQFLVRELIQAFAVYTENPPVVSIRLKPLCGLMLCNWWV